MPNPNRTTVTYEATVRVPVDVTIELTDEAIAEIKRHKGDDPVAYGDPIIVDAKLGVHAGVGPNEVRDAAGFDRKALDQAVVNAVRNGLLGRG